MLQIVYASVVSLILFGTELKDVISLSSLFAACWAVSPQLAEPPLPPTWKIDCARLFFPPDAICATRDAVGWNTEELWS